jgi:hypothetical protein
MASFMRAVEEEDSQTMAAGEERRWMAEAAVARHSVEVGAHLSIDAGMS